LLSAPVFSRFIVNPAVAILLESAAFTLCAVLFAGRPQEDTARQSLAGAGGMLLAVWSTGLLFSLLLRRGPGSSSGIGEMIRFTVLHGTAAAVLAAACTPLGLRTGRLFRRAVLRLWASSPFLSQAALAGSVFTFLAISVISPLILG
jgi:hypothetical protein